MKFLQILSLLALFAGVVCPQTPLAPLTGEADSKPILKFRNEITVGGFGEFIVARKFLDDEDRLLTVTNFGIQYWNVKTGERIRSIPHEIADLEKFDSVISVSPDAGKMIVADGFNFSLKKLLGKKAKLPAAAYSLETGKRIAVLQRPENSIRRAVWTADGKTLLTFSSAFGQGFEMEICFWDGETLEFRGSITANKWNYLTRRGDKFITTSGITKNTFGYKYEKPNTVHVWNTETAGIEKTFTLVKEKSLRNIRVTNDEKYLLTENGKQIILLDLETGEVRYYSTREGLALDSVQMSADKQHLAAKSKRKIYVWKTAGDGFPKLIIPPPAPVGKKKTFNELAGFDFDGRHLGVWQMQNKKALLIFNMPHLVKTELYDLETGKVNSDLDLFIDPRLAKFSADRRYAITRGCDEAVVFSLEERQKLFSFPLKCKTGTTSSYNYSTGETTTDYYSYNDDIIAFHPQKNVSLIVKDDFLELYGANAEQKRLQLIDAPRMLKKAQTRGLYGNSLGDLFANIADGIETVNADPNYAAAGFLKNGDVVFASSADSRSVFFWEVDKNLLE